MRVLHVTPELYPWVKSGGFGDFAAALAALEVDTRLLLPEFTEFLDALAKITDIVRLPTPFAVERVGSPSPGCRVPIAGLILSITRHSITSQAITTRRWTAGTGPTTIGALARSAAIATGRAGQNEPFVKTRSNGQLPEIGSRVATGPGHSLPDQHRNQSVRDIIQRER
jgi:Starch synthase catalytic domain